MIDNVFKNRWEVGKLISKLSDQVGNIARMMRHSGDEMAGDPENIKRLKRSNWPKGVSGNPKGQPKGSINLTSILKRELAKFDLKTQTDEATKIVYTVGQTVPGKRQLPGQGAVCDAHCAGCLLDRWKSIHRLPVRARRLDSESSDSHLPLLAE